MAPRKSKIKVETLPADRAPVARGIKSSRGPKPSSRVSPKSLPDNERVFVHYFRMGAGRTLQGLEKELAGAGSDLSYSLDDLSYMAKTYSWDTRLRVWDEDFEKSIKDTAIEMRSMDVGLMKDTLMGELHSYRQCRDHYAKEAEAKGEPPPTLIGSMQDMALLVKWGLELAAVDNNGLPIGGEQGGRDAAATARAQAEAAAGIMNMFAALAAGFGLKVTPGVLGGPMIGGASLAQQGISAPSPVVDVTATKTAAPVGEKDLLDALHEQAKKGKVE